LTPVNDETMELVRVRSKATFSGEKSVCKVTSRDPDLLAKAGSIVLCRAEGASGFV